MSFTCDECRQKQGLEHGLGYPFMGISRGRCEDCGRVADCEDLRVPFAGMPIRTDPTMPKDEIRLEHPDGRVDRITNIAPPAAPLGDDGDLVQAMIRAVAEVHCPAACVGLAGHSHECHVLSMTAALHVVRQRHAEEFLGPVTDKELRSALATYENAMRRDNRVECRIDAMRSALGWLAAARKSRLLGKEKTPDPWPACPFCGDSEHLQLGAGAIHCRTCKMMGPVGKQPADAVTLWCKRAELSAAGTGPGERT
jgi:hypothetical protein